MAPTLVLVPGSFGKSQMYDPVVLPLREKGYTVHVIDPPCYPNSYVKGAPPPSMFDDAKFISDFVTKVADETGEDIVLLAHSYGGIPTSQSLEHISSSARSSAGKKGGVTHLAYLTAVVPAVGANLVATLAGGAPTMGVSEDGWLFHTDFVATAAMCFNSLSAEEGLKQAQTFERHSSVCFGDALTYPGYKDVGVSWFFCEEDRCVKPEVQQGSIDVIEESWKGTAREGQKVNVTRVKCDHVPVYSAPKELIAWMEGLLA